MIREYSKIIGTHIIHETEGSVIAVLSDIIIHPDTGKVMAFWVKPVSLPVANAVLQADDILEWKKHIYIRDESRIADPADVIKISEVLSRNTYIIGSKVVSETGDYFGKVEDLSFDDENYHLRQIFCHHSFLIFSYSPRIFDYKSIIEIRPEGIVVKDIETKKEKAKAGQPVLDV